MSRRSQAPKRQILPDPKFGSELLAKFMNMIMNDGKKSVAERIIYGALDRISEKETHADDKALELLANCIGQRQACRRSKVTSRRWCNLSGAGRSSTCSAPDTWLCAG